MIQKLRVKFVAVVMGIVGIILLGVFLALLVSTKSGLEQDSKTRLKKALLEGEKIGFQQGEAPDSPQKKSGAPGKETFQVLFVALLEEDKVILLKQNVPLDRRIPEKNLLELMRRVKEGEKFGVFPELHLRYARREVPEGIMAAFADTSMESAAMAQMIKNALLIGGLTLLLSFFVSLILPRWATRPVEQAWLSQKQFVADASHDLKTPLTVILSNAELLVREGSEETLRWAENIREEGLRMKRLTEELLSLTRTEEIGRAPNFQRVNFSYLVSENVLLLEASAFEQGKRLVCSVQEDLFLSGDPAALHKLIEALLDNALKYSYPGSDIRVELSAAFRHAKLTVENLGAPIPPEALPHLFERFYRGDPTRQDTGGHGLGLAIAKQTAELHKGKLTVRSEGESTCFTLALPCERKRDKPQNNL